MMGGSRRMARPLRRMPGRMAWAVLGVALLGVPPPPARAQQAPAASWQQVPEQQNLEILPTLYLWFPWTTTDVRPFNARIPSTSSTIGPGSLISHLTWVPFMGAVEVRSGSFGLITDYLHAPVKAGISTRNIIFTGANAGQTLDSGTVIAVYRAIALPDQYADVGIGVRAWGFDGDISLNPRGQFLSPVKVSNGGSWADPLIGLRYHRDLGNGYGATGYADVGGFGVGAHVDWQLVGTIDYTPWPAMDLHAGFRTINFDINGPRAEFNVHMYGPILGATFHF